MERLLYGGTKKWIGKINFLPLLVGILTIIGVNALNIGEVSSPVLLNLYCTLTNPDFHKHK